MTQATAKITAKFKRTYIRCKDVLAIAAAQAALFSMGFRLKYQDFKDKGYRDITTATPDGRVYNYMMVNEDGEILKCFLDPHGEYSTYREVNIGELSRAADEVRKIKRAESKASKKRRAMRKWVATATVRTTEVCPVRADVIVTVRLNDGSTYTGKAGDYNWRTGPKGYRMRDIVSYKVLVPNEHKPAPSKVVSQEAMAMDIASSVGRGSITSEAGTLTIGSLNFGTSSEILDAAGNVIGFTRVADVANVPAGAERVKLDLTYDAAPVGDVNSDSRGSGARFNAGKPDFSLIPMTLLEGEARVWAYGAKKYAAWNWMKGMDWNVPFACAMRHLAAWQRGEDIDPETGESHLDHAMCNLRMLRYYTDFYKEGDNRPKQFFALESK